MNQTGQKNELCRVQWVEKALQSIPNGSRILDAGAGELQFKEMCAHLEYVSQDFAQYDGQGDRKGLQVGKWDQSKIDIVSDIVSIPQPDRAFDAIMCIEVFEHLPNPTLAIKEFSRLLKPGGFLIITAPFCSLTHFSPYHFYTGFNKYFYEEFLPENSFKILELSANGNFFEYLAQELRRLPEIADEYSHESLHKWEKLAIKIVLKSLERFSLKDTNSSDLLNFGYHVLAVKENQ
jgi:ubiquinone/menaquinone biosynthesis C-methylase UbiE